MNSLIEEYVFNRYPERWSNHDQGMIRCHWFEELPRVCAEDDRGNCEIDMLPDYSRNHMDAFLVIAEMHIKGYVPIMQQIDVQDVPAPPVWRWQVCFVRDSHNYNISKNNCAVASTLELAICQAALIARNGNR